jgi:hypothetical protein
MKRVLVILLFCSLLAGCDKRYEDGPCLSLVKASNRLCGRWTVDKVLLNEEQVYENSGTDTLSTFSFSISGNNNNAFYISLIDTSDAVFAESLLRVDDRIVNLIFDLEPIAGYEESTAAVYHVIPALEGDHSWTITKLKRKEMWMNTMDGSNTQEIRFSLLYDYDNY